MKCNISAISIITGALLWMALTGCRHYDDPPKLPEAEPTTMTLAALSELLGERRITVSEPIVVGGYVTTSDEEANFHKTLIIEDGTAGAEVMVGIYDCYRLYPPGYYITIRLQGCGLGRHYGVMQIGLPADEYSGFVTDYFTSRVMLDRHILPTSDYYKIEASTHLIDDLSADDCGRLITVEHLTLISHLYPDAWRVNQQGTWRDYNIFQDEQERRIAVYTSDYADYADKAIPAGLLTLTGILQMGKIEGEDMFMLKMRYEEDCEIVE